MTEEQKATIGPAGEILGRNVQRIREAQRLTYVALSNRLAELGRPVAVLGLRRIERGERRVDVDDLLALALALNVSPTDLIVPNTLDRHSFSVTPTVAAPASTVREFVRGEMVIVEPAGRKRRTGGAVDLSANAVQIMRFVEWMPAGRRQEVMKRLLLAEQREWQRNERDTAEKGDDGESTSVETSAPSTRRQKGTKK